MKRILLIICCIQTMNVFLTSCNSQLSNNNETSIEDTVLTNNATQTRLESVSIIKLIANPEGYNNRLIRIEGYLNIGFEENAIYLSKDDWDFSINKNGLWVDVENSKIAPSEYTNLNKQYVILEGVFLMDNKGHRDAYSGAVSKITRIDTLENRKHYDY